MATIPRFPELRPVCMGDRAAVERLFAAAQPEVSELTFTNLFMFRHVHDYQIALLNGNLVIYAKSYSGNPYFMPPVGDNDVPATLDALMGYLLGRGLRPAVELAGRAFIERYVAGDGRYGYEPDPDNFDYLYSASELATLAGRKFHDKKNLLNRFLKSYAHEYRPLTEELIPQAKELVLHWCCEKCSLDVPSTYGETEATLLALDHFRRLSLVGGAVLINGKVEAIAFGERLNRETAVIHVEKANSEYAGLYQYISSEFVSREFIGLPYVNREQDLGEPNLRKSKLSYNPIRMVEKFRVWAKE